jgi:hypothetical protein
MLNNQTLQTLRSLKLTGMADALEQQLAKLQCRHHTHPHEY